MKSDLSQYMTPFWFAEALVARDFAHLTERDVVLEPTCGTGAFLRAIPAHVPAYGIEIDQALAERCRRETGRPVECGDIRTVQLHMRPTAVIGNPPYEAKLIEQMLGRFRDVLPHDGMVGFLLPAYFLQAAKSVMRYSRLWGIETQLVPRSIYPRLSKPLVWTLFRKGRAGTLVGLAFYEEVTDVAGIPQRFRELLRDCTGHTWREVVTMALIELGGEASLEALYQRIAPRRPTGNPWWKEKVRQQTQAIAQRTAHGRWRIPSPTFQLEAA